MAELAHAAVAHAKQPGVVAAEPERAVAGDEHATHERGGVGAGARGAAHRQLHGALAGVVDDGEAVVAHPPRARAVGEHAVEAGLAARRHGAALHACGGDDDAAPCHPPHVAQAAHLAAAHGAVLAQRGERVGAEHEDGAGVVDVEAVGGVGDREVVHHLARAIEGKDPGVVGGDPDEVVDDEEVTIPVRGRLRASRGASSRKKREKRKSRPLSAPAYTLSPSTAIDTKRWLSKSRWARGGSARRNCSPSKRAIPPKVATQM